MLATRGLEQVKMDRDEPGEPLVQQFGHSSQDLVNLCLCGRAVTNIFDGNKYLGEEANPPPDAFCLKGVPHEVDVGLLSSLEVSRLGEVGSLYKCPKFPIWVIVSPSHYSLLFGLNPKIGMLSKDEKDEKSVREKFNSLDQFQEGFITFDEVETLLTQLGLSENEVTRLKNKIDESLGVLLWNDFFQAYNDIKSPVKDDKAPPKPWSCPACTYHNTADRSTCEICETKKPEMPLSPPPRASFSAEFYFVALQWNFELQS
jgi:hypothetical protein